MNKIFKKINSELQDINFNEKNEKNDLFWDSKEGFIIFDINKNIVYLNDFAQKLLGSIDTITKIEHQFSFLDVCILKEQDIIGYNPINAAINSAERFKAEALLQIAQDHYKTLIIRSFNIKNNKIIIFSDLSEEIENINLKKYYTDCTKQINKLQQDNEEFSKLKELAETQSIRTGLINRISNSIRNTLNIDKIIKTAVNEISETLGVYKGLFASLDKNTNKLIIKQEWHTNNFESSVKEINYENDPVIKQILTDFTSKTSTILDIKESLSDTDSGNLRPRLVTPVIYQDKILGMMLFYHINNKKTWHQEEISLIEGIASQLAAAIYHASLFEELKKQKKELELTLLKLRETQSQLIQSEKMASLGQLVAGIAHEINTPMGAINSNNDVIIKCTKKLKEKIQENQEEITPLLGILDEINMINTEAIKRINMIVKTLRSFARLDEAELNEVDIHEGIKSSLILINHEIKYRIKVIEEYSNISAVKCYPNLLNQVFMNILVNACQSIDGEGTIKIRTSQENDKLKIEISDTGKGIAENHLNKIFDPGFTTKGVGVGTGLGLSICYQIIEKHKGTIKVDSKVNLGTKFIIELPVD
ncbi:MAG: ATP-binding protein [bacterium]